MTEIIVDLSVIPVILVAVCFVVCGVEQKKKKKALALFVFEKHYSLFCAIEKSSISPGKCNLAEHNV